MGLKALSIEDWIEIDEHFCEQMAEKQRLLKHRHSDVFVSQGDTQLAQQESLSLLVSHLLQYFPEIYQLFDSRQGIYNKQTQQSWKFSDFADAPLDLAGQLVQEDLCLMMPDTTGYCLAAASVCFPLRWTLREKIGKPMSQIHQSVPDYTQKLACPVDNVFARLQADFSGLRFNWNVVDSPELNLAQQRYQTLLNDNITADNAGHTLWLRVERQTIRRLPTSGGILFTIHSYVYPLWQVVKLPQACEQLIQAIHKLKVEMQTYKNLLPFKAALLGYLEASLQVSLKSSFKASLKSDSNTSASLMPTPIFNSL
ncbi:MAG: Protein of unknown function (DUF3445) [Phormidesmis priestleyi Ana]|uniref:DUF3445 domain-containing protein n=1 Tax=Phormidesmis priestleyi Ana TaxID=1666911 RepID=A0A0P7ZNK5_9CYAN|nr:MAG: Protein of unknown function (DUF3445) [Phormidesmis priestleyi Ana]